MNDTDSIKNYKKPGDTKKIFKEKGTCSGTFYYLLNRAFDNLSEAEERAADPLAGGIMRKGHQCGMLWGAALAVGSESWRRYQDHDLAIQSAILATKRIIESFSNRTDCIDCRKFTGTDFSNIFSTLRFFIFRAGKCFQLAEDWAPEAIQAAFDGLSGHDIEKDVKSRSCATEVVKRMGASEEEMMTVAGFAGGLGLSGHGCGALSAAIWLTSLRWYREHPGKSPYSNREAKQLFKAFSKATDSELSCERICGRRFNSIAEHSEFIDNGGCDHLLKLLSEN